jgi:subtilisin-like proprotein convertase family protein
MVSGSIGETVTSIDVTFEVDSPHWDQLKVDLETPGGIRAVIRNTVNGLPDGDQVAEVTVPLGAPPTPGTPGVLLGGPVNGVWKLHVYDILTTTGGAITLESAKLTLHTTGGPEKVARTATWTSPVLDGQTNVFAIDSATWDERVPDGATLDVHVRTCQQADCSDGTWSAPVTKATPFSVTPGRYVQLRVDMTSNGVLEPELQSLNVTYRRDPG